PLKDDEHEHVDSDQPDRHDGQALPIAIVVAQREDHDGASWGRHLRLPIALLAGCHYSTAARFPAEVARRSVARLRPASLPTLPGAMGEHDGIPAGWSAPGIAGFARWR